MLETNTKTMHKIEVESEEFSAGELVELGEVCETKGAFGVQADGNGGLYNPM